MKRKFLGFMVLILICVAGFLGSTLMSKPNDLVDMKVHEWGTFTSIAGEEGLPLVWQPYGGPTDLPCFVNRSFVVSKGGLTGTVRMETPVLYFYGTREATASVKVNFPKGVITEWYPRRSDSGDATDRIEWSGIRVSPSESPALQVEPAASHYYAARKTDAAPVFAGTQAEKFLFYRGVGTFPLPISAKIAGDGRTLTVKNLGAQDISNVVLFENRKGRLRFQISDRIDSQIEMNLSSMQDRSMKDLESALEGILVQRGLYAKEAQAMIETWRDSWFEEGTRLFYIVPHRTIDAALPLDIQPNPGAIDRVFVGRMEILSPWIQEDVKTAIARNDRGTLEKYGRFLEPIAKRIGAKSALLDQVRSSYLSRSSNCR
jgi:hypothetical protein